MLRDKKNLISPVPWKLRLLQFMKDKAPPRNQYWAPLTWFPPLFTNVLTSSSVFLTIICWRKFFTFWKHEFMQRNMAMDSFYWWWPRSSKRHCGVCNASKGESKTIISHDTWNHLVLLGRGLELGLKKVIFLMKTGLDRLPFPFPFLTSWWKKFLCVCACVCVFVCERERKGGKKYKK